MITAIRTRCTMFRFAAVLTFALLGGCTQTPFMASSTPDISAELENVSSLVGNYDDIEMPVDMKYKRENSMAINTESFRGGILNYSGRVDLGSLKEFIVSSMESRKWKLVGEAQSKNILLAFTKPSKTCMVVLDEGVGGKLGNTNATLYVTYDVAASGRLNPFGEPVQ